MQEINGQWYMNGVQADDPRCIHSPQALIELVNEVGFMPLFAESGAGAVPGFSVEERTQAEYWWSGDPERDPWEWRAILARSSQVVYGKLFDKKAGFVSKEWFPRLANYRRDGYDFDALFDDELASLRMKKIMDVFETEKEMLSPELKIRAGFGTGGEKNFPGILTQLQMQTYLVVKDFRKRVNKKGREYGWDVAVLATPEEIWGREYVASCYKEEPQASMDAIFDQIRTFYPEMTEKAFKKLIGIKR